MLLQLPSHADSVSRNQSAEHYTVAHVTTKQRSDMRPVWQAVRFPRSIWETELMKIEKIGTIIAERELDGRYSGKPCKLTVRFGKPFFDESPTALAGAALTALNHVKASVSFTVLASTPCRP